MTTLKIISCFYKNKLANRFNYFYNAVFTINQRHEDVTMKTLSNMLLMLSLSAPLFANNITPPPPPPPPKN